MSLGINSHGPRTSAGTREHPVALQTNRTKMVHGFVIIIQCFKNGRVYQRDVGVVSDLLTNLHCCPLYFRLTE